MKPPPLPDFPLLPHEVPEGIPLVAPADAQFEWEGRDILVRTVKIEREKWVVFVRVDEKNRIVVPANQTKPFFWKEPPFGPPKFQNIALEALTSQQKHLSLAEVISVSDSRRFVLGEGEKIWTRKARSEEQERRYKENPEFYQKLWAKKRAERERREAREKLEGNLCCCGCFLLFIGIVAAIITAVRSFLT